MHQFEHVWAASLVVVAVGAALAFGWRQARFLWTAPASDSEERAVMRRSARRRLVVSALVAACGVLIAGPYLTGLAGRINALVDLPPGERQPLSDEQRHDVWMYYLCWAAVMVALVIALVIIAVDFWDVRRFWRRSLQRLNDDRRAMLERQLARLRAERGGPDGTL